MQNINFYLEQYHPKPLSFNHQFAILTLFLSLLGMLTIGWSQSLQVAQLNKTLKLKQQQSSHIEQGILSIQKQLSEQSVTKDWQVKLNSKQEELNNYRKIISQVNLPIFKQSANYSRILEDLTLQSTNNVWLTRINIQSELLSLYGSSNNSNSIPIYIDQLKQTASLKRYFQELKIEQDSENPNIGNFSLLKGGVTDG